MEDWNVRDYPKKEKWVEALNALVLSIDKWEAIVKGMGIDNGIKNCVLCATFYESDETDDDGNTIDCVGCPVSIEVDDEHCDGTPWEKWANHHMVKHDTPKIPFQTVKGCTMCTILAAKELEFLQSLLPEGEREV